MSELTQQTMHKVQVKGRGAIFSNRDFLDLGSRAAVAQALLLLFDPLIALYLRKFAVFDQYLQLRFSQRRQQFRRDLNGFQNRNIYPTTPDYRIENTLNVRGRGIISRDGTITSSGSHITEAIT